MSPRLRRNRDGSLRPARYRAVQPSSVVWLTVLWMILWGSVSWWMLFSGLVVAMLVSLAFPLPPVELGLRVRPVAFASLLGHFLVDIVRASFEVSAVVLQMLTSVISGHMLVRASFRAGQVREDLLEVDELTPLRESWSEHRGAP